MKTQAKHTATPWKVSGLALDIRDYDEVPIISVPYGDNDELAEANASFIVKAVNSHEALVEALKLSQEALKHAQEGKDFNYAHVLQANDEALKQAEEV